MQKWEYLYFQTEYHLDGFFYTAASKEQVVFKTEDKAQIEDINSHLDKLGEEGWEMLAVNEKGNLKITIYYFLQTSYRINNNSPFGEFLFNHLLYFYIDSLSQL